MVTPPDETTADPYAVIAALRQQLAERSAKHDAAQAREATLAEELAASMAELAQRDTDFDERIEYHAAMIDVLKTMWASPGNAQPVIDLIVNRAKELDDAFICVAASPTGNWFIFEHGVVSIRWPWGLTRPNFHREVPFLPCQHRWHIVHVRACRIQCVQEQNWPKSASPGAPSDWERAISRALPFELVRGCARDRLPAPALGPFL